MLMLINSLHNIVRLTQHNNINKICKQPNKINCGMWSFCIERIGIQVYVIYLLFLTKKVRSLNIVLFSWVFTESSAGHLYKWPFVKLKQKQSNKEILSSRRKGWKKQRLLLFRIRGLYWMDTLPLSSKMCPSHRHPQSISNMLAEFYTNRVQAERSSPQDFSSGEKKNTQTC